MGIKHINQISIILFLLIIELCKSQINVEDREAGGQCMFLVSSSMVLDFHHLKTNDHK
jgi:hypothetical protein